MTIEETKREGLGLLATVGKLASQPEQMRRIGAILSQPQFTFIPRYKHGKFDGIEIHHPEKEVRNYLATVLAPYGTYVGHHIAVSAESTKELIALPIKNSVVEMLRAELGVEPVKASWTERGS